MWLVLLLVLVGAVPHATPETAARSGVPSPRSGVSHPVTIRISEIGEPHRDDQGARGPGGSRCSVVVQEQRPSGARIGPTMVERKSTAYPPPDEGVKAGPRHAAVGGARVPDQAAPRKRTRPLAAPQPPLVAVALTVSDGRGRPLSRCAAGLDRLRQRRHRRSSGSRSRRARRSARPGSTGG